MARFLDVAVVFVGIVLFGTGCGPMISTSLLVTAESQLAGAKAAEADRYALYEYTAAEAYLKKAHEEFGYADYGPAVDYAWKAGDLAEKAIERARASKSAAVDASNAPVAVPSVAPTAPVVPVRP
jgi:Domain of unknown function (DUF4398)